MREELISLQIGQAGIQAGHAFWTQLCAEHAIAPDGVPMREKCDPNEFAGALFTPTSRGTFSPRAFCIDTDPGSLDWLQLGGYRDLYNPSQLISGVEDAAGCFARGYHHFGQHFCMKSKEKIRRVMENLDHFQGFLLFRSLTGGTGSGLSSVLMRSVNSDFTKKNVMSVDILPPYQGSSTLDPYNVILALHETMETSDVSFLLSNPSLFRIVTNNLKVPSPKYYHVNQLVATVASHLTNGLRFQSGLSLTFRELETNLVPLPRLKYPVLAYSPICPPGRCVIDTPMSTIINNVFTPEAQLVPCDTIHGRYLSALLMLRGEYQPDEINQYVYKLTNHPRSPLKFVDWIPPSVKYSMCALPPLRPVGSDLGHVPRTVIAAMNHTGMEPVLRPFISSFRKMFCNKAFLHLYKQEGMEELEFQVALEDMVSLQEDFARVRKDKETETEPGSNSNKGSQVKVPPPPPPPKPCVEITIPRAEFDALKDRKGCAPCINLNIPVKPPLRMRGCLDCGPYKLLRCGRCWPKQYDMTLYGQALQRPPCPPRKPEEVCIEEEGDIKRKKRCPKEFRRSACDNKREPSPPPVGHKCEPDEDEPRMIC